MTKGQMLYEHEYLWKAKDEHDNPHLRGNPDRNLLSRKEGYEVLEFINEVAVLKSWHPNYPHMGHQVEKLLRIMPPEIRKRSEAYDWITTYWHSVVL